MTLVPPSEIRDVTGITPGDTQAIYHFLQGAMYCWCKNRKDEWFSLRDLMGKENFDWDGTPMFALYNKHAGTAANPVMCSCWGQPQSQGCLAQFEIVGRSIFLRGAKLRSGPDVAAKWKNITKLRQSDIWIKQNPTSILSFHETSDQTID